MRCLILVCQINPQSRPTKTQTLWTFMKSGQRLDTLQLISTDKLNPIKDRSGLSFRRMKH